MITYALPYMIVFTFSVMAFDCLARDSGEIDFNTSTFMRALKAAFKGFVKFFAIFTCLFYGCLILTVCNKTNSF